MSAPPAGEGAGRALCLFAKAPRRGQVKTRLEPALGAAGALALHRAFLEDACARVARAPAARRALYVAGGGAPDAGLTALAARHGLALERQEGDDLGARMEAALRAELSAGAGAAFVLGADVPSLPDAHLAAALAALDGPAEVVIGPAADGGYWLLGATAPCPELLDGVPWGTPGVLPETLRRLCASRRGRFALAPLWYDVDRPDDLALLAAHLEALAALGQEPAPATRALLSRGPAR